MENKNGKIMFSVLAIAIILIILVGITYAFFNYTRTGSGNIIKTGRIYFNSEQGTSINLTNMFPIDVTNGVPNDNTKVGTVTINVVGDTDYSGGIEYLIRAVDVYNTVGIGSNQKSVPISVEVSYSANGDGKVIGVLDQDYFTNRGGNSSLYKILAKDEIKENDQLVVGYIASGETGIDGNIQIRAYLDASKIAISDTYPEGDVTHTEGEEPNQTTVTDYTNGTTSTWVGNRVVLTTGEWNSLQANGVSFKIEVEANEGIWVEEPIPIVPSCLNCKFLYTTNTLWTTWNRNSETPSVINDNYSLNYMDIINETNQNVFLGIITNNFNQITNAYVCGINDDKPFCIEGSYYALDNKYYENDDVLVEIYGEYDDENNKGCIHGYNSYVANYTQCYGELTSDISEYGNDAATVYNESIRCEISIYGEIKCLNN